MSVPSLLRTWNVRPSKPLGQSFLIDETLLQRISTAAEPAPEDVVLEIGAGTGALTRHLAEMAGHVVAVELDQRLIPILESELSGFDNVHVIQEDILELNPAALVEDARRQLGAPKVTYKVVGNLPYYITSAILRHMLEADRRPKTLVVTVQYEVAKRLVAKPGAMSVLAVSVQFFGDPEILFRIPSGSFYPSPDVDSAAVRVDVQPAPRLPERQTPDFFRVVRAGFSQRRKQLHNALSAGLGERVSKHDVADRLVEADIDPRRRAQTLSIEEWILLTRALDDILVAPT